VHPNDQSSVMLQVFVYADSLAWGIIPDTRRRLPFSSRWPGVMEAGLRSAGLDVRVIEDCLNGRRTVFDDPFRPGRNGLVGLEQRIESHSPLSLVVLMLGTNDFQSTHQYTAWHSAQGMGALIDAVRRAPIEPGMPVPPVLVVAPPPFGHPRGAMAPKFEGAPAKSAGLAAALEAVARERQCGFFDAGLVTGTSEVDGVHLDAPQHAALGRALAAAVAPLLTAPGPEATRAS
jgi:lysophospholipase L1-like esterase